MRKNIVKVIALFRNLDHRLHHAWAKKFQNYPSPELLDENKVYCPLLKEQSSAFSTFFLLFIQINF